MPTSETYHNENGMVIQLCSQKPSVCSLWFEFLPKAVCLIIFSNITPAKNPNSARNRIHYRSLWFSVMGLCSLFFSLPLFTFLFSLTIFALLLNLKILMRVYPIYYCISQEIVVEFEQFWGLFAKLRLFSSV